jgi:hypothetical protein
VVLLLPAGGCDAVVVVVGGEGLSVPLGAAETALACDWGVIELRTPVADAAGAGAGAGFGTALRGCDGLREDPATADPMPISAVRAGAVVGAGDCDPTTTTTRRPAPASDGAAAAACFTVTWGER